MILADTSVWIAHLRQRGTGELGRALDAGEILGHPHVLGELACGNLRNRSEILGLLRGLPLAVVATSEEALACLEERRLSGLGLGWTDVHLLASALLSRGRLWTLDRALAREARRHGIAFE